MIRPSASEFALLKPLWSSGGLSAREIHNEVEAALEWSFSSTRKTLDRMVDKKLVRVEPLHGVKVYHAEAGKISVVAALTRDFMGRVLEIGDPVPAAAFNGSRLLSEEEILELEQALRQSEDT